jgi:hypothetical protein
LLVVRCNDHAVGAREGVVSDFIACYRSAAADVIAAWDAYCADRERFSADVEALTAEMWPEAVDGHKPEPLIATSSWDPGKRTLIGWSWPWGVQAPEGWRVDKKGVEWTQMITPKRSTKEGKALAKRLDAVTPVAVVDMPGMPLFVLALPATYSPAVERHGDTLYVGWGFDVEGHDHRSTPGGKPLDLDKWERIKVSEFFAAREDDPADAGVSA